MNAIIDKDTLLSSLESTLLKPTPPPFRDLLLDLARSVTPHPHQAGGTR